VGRIHEQDLAQLRRGQSTEDPSPEAVSDQLRDPSAVVDVGVGEKEGRDLFRTKSPSLSVQRFHLLSALKKAAVNEVSFFVLEEES